MTAVLRDDVDASAVVAHVPFGRLGPPEAARLAEILAALARLPERYPLTTLYYRERELRR